MELSFEVKDENGNHFAKKVLKNIKSKKNYQRFKDEVEILNNLKSKKGIIEIIDNYFPSELKNGEFPYYIMPIGKSLKDSINTIKRDRVFEIIFELCDTLQYLHSQDITHRDIKPENILLVNDSPVFSDFGLANFPKKERISNPNEQIGPKWTIAPEMKRISSSSEYKKADIYSLSKTIWMILTQQWRGFDGQYIPNSNISLGNFIKILTNKPKMYGVWEYNSIVLLDRLLVKSTDNNPDKRPNAKEFNEHFRYWHSSNDNYFERNPYEWEDALLRIFPISIPSSSSWTKISDIKNVLSIIFESYDNLNHCFYPRGGGNDFHKIEIDKSREYLIIENNCLLKPKILLFEFLDDLDWSYFRLEVESIPPIYKENIHGFDEQIFINENGDYSGEELPNYREYSRYVKGSFLITKKTSRINQLNGELNAYNGLHNKGTNKEYKELMIRVKNKFENSCANS